MLRSFLLLISVVVLACNNSDFDKKKIENTSPKWESLEIKVDDKTINVFFDNDSCYFTEFFKSDTLFIKEHLQYRSESSKFILPKSKRDELLRLSEEAIKNPIASNQNVSCNSGQFFSLKLKDGKTSISCDYSGVSCWSEISLTLDKINVLTFVEYWKSKHEKEVK